MFTNSASWIRAGVVPTKGLHPTPLDGGVSCSEVNHTGSLVGGTASFAVILCDIVSQSCICQCHSMLVGGRLS